MKKIPILPAFAAIMMLSSLSANTMRVCNLDMAHYMKTDERKQSIEKKYLTFTVQNKSSFVAKLDDVTSAAKIYEFDTGMRIVIYDNQTEVKLITDTITAFLIQCKPVQ